MKNLIESVYPGRKFPLLYVLDLKLFDQVINASTSQSTGNDLSPEMKTYYSDYLVDNAAPNLVHDQFGQKHPIPKNGGKTIEFRKYSPLPKATTPLTEGVTPDGRPLNVSTITATVAQYGDYILMTDILLLTAIDNNLVQATELLGDQAGRTLDTVTREVINGGTNVMYAPIVASNGTETAVSSRAGLTKEAKLTVGCVHKAVRYLKTQLSKKIEGSYVAIIHPDVAYDLMRSEEWIDSHKYAAVEELFSGEIGKIGGCRFVETTEAKIFSAPNLKGETRTLTVASWTSATKTVAIDEALTAAEATALVGRKVIIDGVVYTVKSATAGDAAAASFVVNEAAPDNNAPADGDVVYPGEAGAAGIDVYSTLFVGANAYGVTEITGGGLQHIVKPLGSGGTSDPLNQRCTVGWKATKVAERLVENYLVRFETASTFDSGAN